MESVHKDILPFGIVAIKIVSFVNKSLVRVSMDTDKHHSDPDKFCFYCPATHVMSQVLQPKSVNKWYRGRHTFISLYRIIILTTGRDRTLKNYFLASDL